MRVCSGVRTILHTDPPIIQNVVVSLHVADLVGGVGSVGFVQSSRIPWFDHGWFPHTSEPILSTVPEKQSRRLHVDKLDSPPVRPAVCGQCCPGVSNDGFDLKVARNSRHARVAFVVVVVVVAAILEDGLKHGPDTPDDIIEV